MRSLVRVVGGLYGLLRHADRADRRQLRLALGLAAVATLADATSLALLQRAAARLGAGTGAARDGVEMLVGFLGVTLLASLLRLLAVRRTTAAQHAINRSLAVRAFEALQFQSYRDYLRQGASQGVAAFEQLQLVMYNALIPLVTAITMAFGAVAICATAALIYPAAGAALFAAVVLIAAEGAWRGARAADSAMIRPARSRARLLFESRSSFRDIFLANAQRRMCEDFTFTDGEVRDRQLRTSLSAQSSRYGVEIAALLAALLLLVAIGTDPPAWRTMLPALGTVAFAAYRLLPQAAAIRSAMGTIGVYGPVTNEMLTLLDEPRRAVPAADEIALADRIELRGVTVRREDAADTLHRLDLVIPRGARIGIRGNSGAGKSTLLDVLCGALPVDEGQVLIDGQPLDPAGAERWRDRIGLVAQQPLLLGGSLREAVIFPQRLPECDAERYAAAVEQSGIAAVAATFDQGMDTPIGEALSRLSGGQRQRLALAHALYRARDLLLLDEATGQLDAAGEEAIVAVLGLLPRTLTVVVVSHRAAPFRHCDRVYRLAGGTLTPDASAD